MSRLSRYSKRRALQLLARALTVAEARQLVSDDATETLDVLESEVERGLVQLRADIDRGDWIYAAAVAEQLADVAKLVARIRQGY